MFWWLYNYNSSARREEAVFGSSLSLLSLSTTSRSRAALKSFLQLFSSMRFSLSFSRAKAAVLGGKFLRVIFNGLAVVVGEFVVHLFEAPQRLDAEEHAGEYTDGENGAWDSTKSDFGVFVRGRAIRCIIVSVPRRRCCPCRCCRIR